MFKTQEDVKWKNEILITVFLAGAISGGFGALGFLIARDILVSLIS